MEVKGRTYGMSAYRAIYCSNGLRFAADGLTYVIKVMAPFCVVLAAMRRGLIH